MTVTSKRARELALSLADTSEAPHFDRTAFRTPRKIFATLANDGRDLNLMFDATHQEHFCEQAPKAFAPVPGGWGKMGATRCDLKQIDAVTLLSALKAAHALAAPKPKPAPKPRG
ncbi:MAG: MmcQ/YjbR family DNA-binding protein [Alphaproteobacteria bacterium]